MDSTHMTSDMLFKQLETNWHWQQAEDDYNKTLEEYYTARRAEQQQSTRLNQILYFNNGNGSTYSYEQQPCSRLGGTPTNNSNSIMELDDPQQQQPLSTSVRATDPMLISPLRLPLQQARLNIDTSPLAHLLVVFEERKEI